MDPNPFRDLGPQQGDGLVMALELVLTTASMGGIGYLLDGWLGTTPFLMVFLAAFTLVYEVWKLVGTYNRDMAGHDERRQPLRQGPVR